MALLRYINKDTLQVQSRPDFATAIESIQLKFQLTYDISVQFTDNTGTVRELDGSPTGKFYIKQKDDYDGPTVAATSSWTITGSGADTVYTFTINMNTTELAALLPLDTPSVDCMGAFWWEDSSDKETLTFDVTVLNNIVKGTEGDPTSGAPSFILVDRVTGDHYQVVSDNGILGIIPAP
jgi:hypothetical protein